MRTVKIQQSRSRSFGLVLALVAVVPVGAYWSAKSKQETEVKVPALSPTKGHDPLADGHLDYGVDISFPMHYLNTSTNYAWLPHNLDPSLPTPSEYKDMPIQPLGRKQEDYQEFIDGCVKAFGKRGRRCIETEKDRIDMSLRQPQSMVNYTELGYKKIRAPPELFKMISDFWEKNKGGGKTEQWGVGNTYTNNWVTATEMVSVEDSKLRGGGYTLKQKLWDAAKETLMEWTGEDLTQCSLYGVRVYKEGAVLATHVDRLPLVSSAIINVAQDLDEPWPLEVIGHDGRAANVTMEPGDMVLYESHSVLHGRPFPLKGRFMANLFVHFEPTGHSLRHHGLDFGGSEDVHEKYRRDQQKGVGGHENAQDGLPPYIVPGTPEESHWRRQHPTGYKEQRKTFTTGSTMAHSAAKAGAVEELKAHIKKNKDVVNAKDENGWTPLHEAIRGGHHDAVKLLVEHGADVNAKTSHNGGTALWWAKKQHEDDHPIVTLLESVGALYDGPEL